MVRNIASFGSARFTCREKVSASTSSFFSFEIFAATFATEKPITSASCCLMIRLSSARESPES